MFSSTMRGSRRGLLLLAACTILAGTALHAQDRAALPPGAVVQPLDDAPGAELRRNLNTLAQNPRSVPALDGAGRAALEMGDPEAALNFFARAGEAEPGNARAKAGMAASLVHLERAREAMPLFAEAISLGAPEAEIAAERGLAWDSLGEPARAQADYALALRREDDPEVRRRMALSLAISGQREAALRMIDAQLRNHDRAAWRTQAFVLALTGDAAGADETARNMMPAGAQALAPFFARLSGLSPSQKALAVHFGDFPSDGRAASYAQADSRADPGAIALADGDAPMGAVRPRPSAGETLERRRPDVPISPLERDSRARRDAERRPVEFAEARPRRTEPQPQRPATGGSNPDEGYAPGFILAPQGRQPEARPRPRPAPARVPAPARAPAPDFSSVAATVAGLPADDGAELAPPVEGIAPPVRIARQPTRSPPPSARSTAQTGAAVRATPARPSRARPAPPANPSRAWVQIATGEKAGLVFTLRTFRERAPALLGSRTAFTAPVAATNRLLIGPFDSEREAQAFVNQLRPRNVPGLVWTSAAGQQIDRLQTGNDTRNSRTRSEPEPRTAARGSHARSGPEPGNAARGSRARAAPEPKPAARGARGRSEPEPRPAARGRRTH